ncbi:MAG: flagellar basal body rod protein FlgB [Deltaproteobacteria bacterium]|nr:flagellar basal body rod protein FlgB [Deltaproteobacteria bacterium]
MDWLGGTVSAVEDAMRFRVARQAVLAANVANADTPGYRSAEVTFADALARGAAPRRTQAGHLGGDAASGWRITAQGGAPRPDGNDVDVDRELVALSRNAGAFREQAEVLSRLFALRQIALGRGR